MSGKLELILIRHAATEWNEEGRWQCSDDMPLSDLGRRQAAALANELADTLGRLNIEVLLTSPLARARHTADVIGAKLGLQPKIEPLLSEFDCGELSGLTYEQARERYADFYIRLREDWMGTQYPGGESHRAYLEGKVLPALERICESNEGGTVAAVTHGGFIRQATMQVMASPEGIPLKGMAIENCSYFAFELEPGIGGGPPTGTVTGLNLTAHLRKALSAGRL